MKRFLIALFLLLFTSPLYAFGPAIQAVVSAGGAAETCNAATNEVGQRGDGGTESSARSADMLYCVKKTADCSGPLKRAYVRGSGDNTVKVKLLLYSATTTAPADADSLLAVSNGITMYGGVSWEYGSLSTGYSPTNGTSYWVCAVIDTASVFYLQMANGVNSSSKAIANSYATPPSTLSTGGWTDTADRDYSMYFSIGP